MKQVDVEPFFAALQASMNAVAASETWGQFTQWYVALPIFG